MNQEKQAKTEDLYRKSPFVMFGDKMTQARLEINDYTTRVLDVIKGKFGLKNRSEALDRFAREFGEEFVEPELDEEYAKKLNREVVEHMKKYKNRRMTEKELDKILGLD